VRVTSDALGWESDSWPNGVVGTPDGKKLYVNKWYYDNKGGTWVFDIKRDGKPHSAVGISVDIGVRTGVGTAYPHPNQFHHNRIKKGDALQVSGGVKIGGYGGELYRAYANPAISQVVGYYSRRFGSAGLERAYSAELAGLATDPLADALRKFGGDPYDPQDLHLSLDYDLQRAAIRALGDQKGAVVMMDPTTGEILAMASNPTYDASAIADPRSGADTFAALQDDPDNPLLPRATLGRYVPGSVFKIVTAIAGLGSGAITPETTFPEQAEAGDEGLLVNGFRVRNSHSLRQGQALTLGQATEISSNIYFALVGLATGGEKMVEFAERLGFGAPLPFDLPTAASQVTNGRGDEPGGFVDDVELANAAYGQGETFVTPLQMALVASTVANDGVLMKPFPPNLLHTRVSRLLRIREPHMSIGTNVVCQDAVCPSCGHGGGVGFDAAAHRRMWYACLPCGHVWMAPHYDGILKSRSPAAALDDRRLRA